jgi:hypothetical protein
VVFASDCPFRDRLHSQNSWGRVASIESTLQEIRSWSFSRSSSTF